MFPTQQISPVDKFLKSSILYFHAMKNVLDKTEYWRKKLKKALLIPVEYWECVEDFWHGNYIMKDCPVFPVFSTYVACHDKEPCLAAVDTLVEISCAELLQDWGQVFHVE